MPRRSRLGTLGALSALLLSGCPFGHDLDYERGGATGGASGTGGVTGGGGGTGATGGAGGVGGTGGASGTGGADGGGAAGSGGSGGSSGAGASGGAAGSGGSGGAAGAGGSGGSGGVTGGGGSSGGTGGAAGTGGSAGTGGWVTGDYFSLPSGFVNKAFAEPCATGADCQMNSACWHPKTAPACGHRKCEVGGKLSWACDPCVKQICEADQTCCTYPDTVPNGGSCAHDLCAAGAKLAKDCDEDGSDCVESICNTPGLESCCQASGSWSSACVAAVTSVCGLSCPLSPAGTWTASCVAKVATLCNATCDTSPPIDEEGKCKEWLPGQKDPTCSGIDLALGITCSNTIPVCNHGNAAAPSGIRVVHYPANSNQYPKCTPDQAHPQMYECFTTKPIAPGQCGNDLQYWNGSAWVAGCGSLVGNREIMVNPQVQSGKPTPSGYPGHVSECSCQDNWTLYAAGTCAAPACGHDAISAKKRNLFFLVDRSGSMVSSGLWTPAVAGMTAFFQAGTSAGLGVSMEFFPLNSGGSRGDGCASPDPSCSVTECSNAMVPLGTLTAAAAPTDVQEQALIAAFALVHPSDNAAGTGGGTPTYPALDGALKWAKAASTPTERADVVLLTDGPPSRCDTSAANAAALAARRPLEYSQALGVLCSQ